MTHEVFAWFFRPAPARRLALLRIAVGLFALWYMIPRIDMIERISGGDLSLFAPVGVFRPLTAPLPLWGVQGMLWTTVLSGVAFTLGAVFRVSGPLFACSLLATLCYRNSWSMSYHSDNLLVLHAIVLALAPSAHAFALGPSRDFGARSGAGASATSWRYGWPIQLICALTVAAYFLAGIAKLVGPLGWQWITGEAMRSQIAADALRKELFANSAGAGFYDLYAQTWIFALLGFVAIVLELGAPLALCAARLGRFWAVQCWFMHWGILLLLGITFRYQLSGVALLAFFPIERVVDVFAGRRPSARAADAAGSASASQVR